MSSRLLNFTTGTDHTGKQTHTIETTANLIAQKYMQSPFHQEARGRRLAHILEAQCLCLDSLRSVESEQPMHSRVFRVLRKLPHSREGFQTSCGCGCNTPRCLQHTDYSYQHLLASHYSTMSTDMNKIQTYHTSDSIAEVQQLDHTVQPTSIANDEYTNRMCTEIKLIKYGKRCSPFTRIRMPSGITRIATIRSVMASDMRK